MSDEMAYTLISWGPIIYLVLQIAALVAMRDRLRTVAKVCAWIMVGVVAFVLYGVVIAQSNLAPIWIVFAAPILTVVLLILWAIQALRWLRT